jgi:hypothetical protein
MGQPLIVQEISCLVRQFCPKIVFLSETRQQNNRVNNLRFRLGFRNSFVVDGHGKGGGLVLYWDESIKLNVLSYGQHHIDTLIWDSNHQASWHAMFVYGEPCAATHHVMWESLRRLKPISRAPWMLIGDFNEAMWLFEQFSACKRPERQMANFRDVLADCELLDLGFTGVPWTFDYKQKGDRNVNVRLDRVVASLGWSNWFPVAKVLHLITS